MARPAITLIIETSNPGSASGAGEVGLAHGAELAAARALHPKGRHDDALMPAIAALCDEQGVGPAELGLVAVSVGPGGYSSVRIAIATAKMIAMASGAGCVPVPSDGSAVHGAGVRGSALVAMASKSRGGGSAWVRRYSVGEAGAEAHGPGEVVGLDGLRALHERDGFGALVADEHLPDEMRAWANGAGVTIAPPALTAESCLAASAGIAPVPAMHLEAVYPREPEAVRQWRELGR
jgi:tRNA threonylcarbamoyladenosine biosynthesis protein TsaB